MGDSPTYVFRGERAYAVRGNQVIAAGTDADELREVVEAEDREKQLKPKAKRSSRRVVTPNGLQGEILGNTTVWGGELTVRYANGTIATILAEGVQPAEDEPEARIAASADPISKLEERLANVVTPEDREGVVSRLAELAEVERELEALNPRGVRRGTTETARLQAISAGTRHEAEQLRLALDQIEQAEAQGIEPRPFSIGLAPEQAEVGDFDGAGLEEAYQQMQDELRDVDFDEVLREDPAVLVEGLADPILDDAAEVADLALAHVRARTAGVDSAVLPRYEETFVQRAEQARLARIAKRPAHETPRTSSSTDLDDLPDEVMFL